MAHQHKVAPGELAGLLDGVNIRRAFHHTNLAVLLTARIGADGADVLLGEGAAVGAVADFRHRARQRLRQAHAAAAIALQQLKRHALRRFRADARQAAQRLHQGFKERAGLHQNGILKPGGNCMPLETEAIFSF